MNVLKIFLIKSTNQSIASLMRYKSTMSFVNSECPQQRTLWKPSLKHPNAMFVTVPCDATKSIIQQLYSDQQPIATVPSDNGAELTDIYPGLCTNHCYDAWLDLITKQTILYST